MAKEMVNEVKTEVPVKGNETETMNVGKAFGSAALLGAAITTGALATIGAAKVIGNGVAKLHDKMKIAFNKAKEKRAAKKQSKGGTK